MADVSVDVSGVMSPPVDSPRAPFSSFLQVPTQIPDPKEWFSKQRQNVRPWLLFIQTSNFKTPPSIPRLSKRIMRNIEYFQSNYLFVFLGLVVYCLITSPLILFALAGTFYAGYKLNKRHQEKKIVLFKKELTLAQVYGLVAVCSMPIYYMVGAHGAMFWVLGASFFLITLHASFYNIDAVIAQGEDGFPLLEQV
ncbi:prenylated Rab acceptor protein 1 [Tribolium madens]|uniref:prenylated Rab acceptor protein 1 n=1 Tax=Tribolium madens TaxID=41895 RepID=UPI001CF7262A|nr:prenylated Rab acceptor protein 1 [Tribolium madens]XP_044260917.1 prenylated Rab acceptor protein 1 [Tribolium madens]